MKDFTITSLDSMMGVSLQAEDNGLALFILDELQNTTLANTEETTDITGKMGRKISSIKMNKAATISGTNGFISGGLLAVQAGDELHTGAADIMIAESVTLTNGVGDLTKTIADGVTKVNVRLKDANGSLGDAEVATVASNKVTVTSATSVASAEAVVYYPAKATGVNYVTNYSDHYSSKCELYVDGTCEDACGQIYKMQIHAPKASFDGNFDLAFGDSQSVHNFNAELLAGCGTTGELWTMYVYTDNGFVPVDDD